MKNRVVLIAVRWLFAVGTGVAVYLWVTPSLVAAIVVSWYVWESAYPYPAALRHRSHRCEAAWVYGVPRIVGTMVAFALAYLVFLPWEQVIALTYPLLLILEGVYRLSLRRIRPALYDRAQLAIKDTRGPKAKEGRLLWHGIPALLCASLLVIVFPPTLYIYGLRQVTLDARFYVTRFEKWELYDEIAQLAGDIAIDTAADALRKKSPDARRALRMLTEEDKAIIAQTLFPKQWTEAVVEQALDATLSWIQSEDSKRVPSISLPVHDVKRHLQETVSVLLDRRIAALPICTPDMPSSAFCRPAEMSVVAYTATYKPKALAAVDEAFELIPAELDLSTAVTLFPRTFQRPLAVLAQVRAKGHDLERALAWTGSGCLLAWLCLWLFSSVSLRSALCWTGMTLFVAAGRAWMYSWAVSAWPRAVLEQYGVGLSSGLPDLPLQALNDLTRSTYALLLPWILSLAGVGLFMAIVGNIWLLARPQHATESNPVRVLVTVLAIGFLFWRVYLDVGRRLYSQAYVAHRQGDAAQAIAGYRQIEQLYPFSVDTFVERARRRVHECRRYQEAEAAYRAGEYESAAQEYEALMVGNPTIALRNMAQSHLVESLYKWAESLRKTAKYERALDRYRFIRDESQDQHIQRTLADLYMAWGQALRQDGDYGAAVATYRRITCDVFSVRLWANADEQIMNTYCEWGGALRAGGHAKQADYVCEEFSRTFSPADARLCPACVIDNLDQ